MSKMSYVPPPTPTFEKDRIRALKNERISSQKKTFTKWINSFLNKSNLHVNDLFEDLADGRILISLLEIISGEKIGIAARGKFRVHNIQNINRALEFLQKSVKLESIGAEDIIDGNERLILGLVWMIILRFQIADISYEDEMSRERKSAKEALLLWCQRMTRGYPGVDIQNFTTSWRNGLAFNALIHKHRPDLIDYASLRPSQHEANLNNAFMIAEDKLGIARLLDAEDVDCPRPDDRSIMTYVSAYYQYFAKMKSEETGGRRVAKIISVLMEIEGMQDAYESMVSDLLSWINTKILDMSKPFHKSLSAVQKEMMTFKHFRTIEKPPKYAERVNIEAHLFNLQTKRTANQQKPYAPPEGTYVKDVNRAWQVMETAEHNRALALRNELIRQEMLEKMADKFERKATLRESWLDDMMHVLEEEQLAQDAATVEAALKRHEAISTDVKAREERFQMVFNLAQELIDEDYHRCDVVRAREEVIMTKWDKLVGKLEGRRLTLMGFKNLVGVLRDMESAQSDLADIEGKGKRSKPTH